jgi:large subunit ribosomal protein L20
MPRAVDGTRRLGRRKKLLKRAKGFWGRRSKIFKHAKETLWRAGAYAFRDRRARKGEFRSLWITRLSAACRAEGVSYSRFMHGLQLAGITLNRKLLSNMAIEDPAAFRSLAETAKTRLVG